ncbi:MAG: hypothetical protein RL591_1566 [Planctomycetota bacterium]|jgi:hypothetical protein
MVSLFVSVYERGRPPTILTLQLLAMPFRRHITLFATILAFAAAIASGGGVARFVHMTVAHGGGACAAHVGHVGHTGHGGHAGHASRGGPCDVAFTPSCSGIRQQQSTALARLTCEDATAQAEHTRTTHPAVPHNDCPVCAELAVQLPAPELESPFDLTVEVLAIVHEREAARQPKISAPRVFAARPPPTLL